MTGLATLVNKQFKQYAFRLKLSGKKESHFKPCITVSQENGSGGRPIAKAVSQALGYKFYDNRLIELIAKKVHLKKGLVRSLDEKSLGSIESIVNTFLGIRPLPEYTYVKSLVRVVLAIAHKGKAVILGRGANFIVPPERALRVRIIAPLKIRLQNSKQYEHPKLSEMDIKDRIMKVHIDRKEFIQKYFHKDLSNANYYDLVINTENLSLKQACQIIISAYKAKFSKD